MCGICQKNVVNAKLLPCLHAYSCWECSSSWLNISSTCPLCKCQVVNLLNLQTKEAKVIEPKRHRCEEVQICEECYDFADENELITCDWCGGRIHAACSVVVGEERICHECDGEDCCSETDDEYIPSDEEPRMKKRRLQN